MKKIVFSICFIFSFFGVVGQGFGNQDLTFRPDDKGFGVGVGTSNPLIVSAMQNDGKLIVANYNYSNTTFNETAVKRIFRLNTDGTLDNSFNPPNMSPGYGAVTDILVKTNGNILICGRIISSGSYYTIIELNPNGTMTSFQKGNENWGNVNHMEYQPNGEISIFGTLLLDINNPNTMNQVDYVTSINESGVVIGPDPNNVNSNYPRSSVKSVLVDKNNLKIVTGNFDTTNQGSKTNRVKMFELDQNGLFSFNSGDVWPLFNLQGIFSEAIIQNDDKIIINSSNLTTYNGVSLNNSKLIRLNRDRSIDLTFNFVGDKEVSRIFKLNNGDIYVHYAYSRELFKLNADGSINQSFNFQLKGRIADIQIDKDNKLYLIGTSDFSLNGLNLGTVIRLNVDGSLDSSFNFSRVPIFGPINTIEVQNDNKNLYAGDLSIQDVYRVDNLGEIDGSFTFGNSSGKIYKIKQLSNGQYLVAGNFVYQHYKNLIKINVDGTIDNSFLNAQPDSTIKNIIIQNDGKFLIYGDFSKYNTTPFNKLLRINPDGSVDNTFNIGLGFDNKINAIQLDANNQAVVGGVFSNFNGVSANKICRLKIDGTLDTSFHENVNVNSSMTVINTLSILQNNKIIIGGTFTKKINSFEINGFAQLDINGKLDTLFDARSLKNQISNEINLTKVNSNGNIIIVGKHYENPDGIRTKVVCSTPNGKQNLNFKMGYADNEINDIAFQNDGKILLGGKFNSYLESGSYDYVGRSKITRLYGENIQASNNIVYFGFNNFLINGVINDSIIDVFLPIGSSKNNLTAYFVSSLGTTVKIGTTIQNNGSTVNDFSNPVYYTVVAQNGATKKYRVNVSVMQPKSSAKDITAFSFDGLSPIITATISGNNITATVPFGTAVTDLKANFSSSALSTVKVGLVTQVSKSTPNNFTNPVTYIVTAEDGSTKNYTVTISVALNTEKRILSYTISSVAATISNNNITATVPNNTDLSNLVATFTSSAASTVKIGSTNQVSGTTSNNFSSPVVYTVVAEDGSTSSYTVTITLAAPVAPVVGSAISVCYGNTILDLTAQGTNLKWYSDVNLTNKVGTNSPFSSGLTSVGVYTYYVTQTINGVESLSTTTTLTIKETPSNPVSGGNQTTEEGSAIPSLTAKANSGETLKWYSGVALTTLVSSGNVFTPSNSVVGDYFYYVTSEKDGCKSSATSVKLSITSPPAAWTIVSPSTTSNDLYGIATPSANSSWTIGKSGALLSNSSNTWSVISSGLSSDINGISFNGVNNGWTVGKTGKILRYDGSSWSASLNSSSTTLFTVCAVDVTTAFAAGQYGRLLKYSNGSWSIVSNSSVTSDLKSMSFAGASKGIIVGTTGTIMSYNGTSWSVSSPYSDDLFGVHLLSANSGWAVGASGTILKYDGTNWTKQTSVTSNTLRSVYFINSTNGWAVGDNGTLLKYNGTTWSVESSGTTSNLNGIAFNDAKKGWAVGSGGIILAYSATINTVTPPIVVPQTICFGETTPTFTTSGTSVNWYSDALLTNSLSTGLNFTSSETGAGTYTYYVTQTVNGIRSAASTVTLTIKALPTAPTSGGNQVATNGGVISPLTVVASSNVKWYSDANLTSLIASGVQYTPSNPSIGTNTYYVTQTNNSCESTSTIITLKLNAASLSSAKDITSFSFEGLSPRVTATISGNNITATVPYGTNVTSLVATFGASASSVVKVGSIVQVSGVTANNFTNSVTYTVTAEDASVKTFTVTITKEPAPLSSAKDVTSFIFEGLSPRVSATISGNNITATVPYGTNVTSLVASFVSSVSSIVKVGSIVQVSGVTANDFTNSVIYTVTAEDASVQTYTVTINIEPATLSSAKDVTSFSIEGLSTTVIATISGNNITATVPYGTNVTSLIVSFGASVSSVVTVGSIVQVSGVTANDFTNSVTYTVTAEDGSVQTFTVTINIEPAPLSSAKDVTSFSIEGLSTTVIATISGNNITATLPYGTDVTSLVVSFGASSSSVVTVGSIVQVSGVTANDFTNSVIYTVTAEDASVQTYIVTINIEPAPLSSAKDVTSFSIEGLSTTVIATISGNNITATVPYGTDVTSLVVSFGASASSVVKVGSIVQVSGVTANDFTNSVIYTVTAEDGSVQTFKVLITVSNEVLGIDEVNATNIKLYPNPSNGILNIIGEKGLLEIQIINAFGIVEIEDQIINYNGEQLKLDVSELFGSVYTVKIKNNTKGGNFKLIILPKL